MKSFYSRKLTLLSGAMAVIGLTAISFSAQAADKKQVNFFNYADYFDGDSIKAFEKATGIKVVYDAYDSVGSAESKLVTGASGYDVVNADIVTGERLVKAGILHKLDKSKLPNWKNLNPVILKKMEQLDPGNNYMVPNFYGTTGFSYNPKKINAIMKDAPLDSMAMLLNPDIVKKFKSCGVNFLDSSADVIGMTLVYLGKDPNPKTTDDVDAAMDVLWKVRPYITTFDATAYIDSLASGEVCLSMTWGGDHLKAMNIAEASGAKTEIKYTLPKEGTTAWFEGFIIPKTAKNLESAYAFLNMSLDAKVSAANSNLNNYPNGNMAATPFVNKKLSEDKGAYPDVAVFAKITPFLNTPSQKMDDYIVKSWSRLKQGRK